MHKNVLLPVLLATITLFSIHHPEPTASVSTPSSYTAPLTAVCIAGGMLASYGLYKWLFARSTWSVAVIKKDTEELLRATDLDRGNRYPIEWLHEPIITPHLPRNQASVTVEAKLMPQEKSWSVYYSKVSEKPGEIFCPGSLWLEWRYAGDPADIHEGLKNQGRAFLLKR